MPKIGTAAIYSLDLVLSDNCSSPEDTAYVNVIVNSNPYVQTITQRDSCEPLGMVFMPYPED